MAGQDESLVLAANIVSNYGPVLKDMQRSLRALSAETTASHKLGVVQAKSHTESLYALRREVTAVADRVKVGLAPAMSTLGLGSLSAAAGVAALAKSLADFAGSARHLTFLSKQTQLTIGQLRIWESEASRLETTAESLTGGFVTFNEQMEKMRRGGPFIGVRREIEQLRSTLGVFRSGELENLVKGLQGLGREQQLEKVLKFLDRIDNISQRRKVLQAFGLDPALANKASGEILKDIDDIHKRLGDLTPEQLKAGTEFQEAIENIKTSLTGLRDLVGANLAPDIKKVAEAIAEWAKVNQTSIADGLRQVVGAAGEFVTGVGAMKNALDAFREEKPIDWATLLNISGLSGTFELFKATWAANWEQFKTSIGLGDKGAAGAAEAERRRLLKEKSPEQFDREEKERRDEQEKGLQGGLPFAPRWPVPQIEQERIMPPAGTGPGGKDTRPLWRRLFDLSDKGGGGAIPASWTGALNTPGAGDNRGAVRIIEEGTLAALRDFAAEQKGDAGGGGGMGAIRANFAPGGGGLGGAGGAAGEPSADGGAGTTGGAARAPMGRLPGLGGGPGGGATLPHFGTSDIHAALRSGRTPAGVESVRQALGGGGGTGPGSGPLAQMPQGRQNVARVIADAWRKEGMSESGIAGILANVRSESNFNPTLRHADQPHFGGEAHFAHGLYQEGGTEWNHYASWLQKNYPGANWQDPKLQSEFAAWNLKANYPRVWAQMNQGNAGQAAAAYIRGYLKPAAGFMAARTSQYLRGVPSVESYTGPRQQTPAAGAGMPGVAAGVKSGVLPFGESPNAEELRKMTGGINLHRPRHMPNIGAAIGGTDTDMSRSRAIRNSLKAIHEGQHDDLKNSLTGGGRFTMPRPGQKDTLGTIDRNLRMHGDRGDPDIKDYPRSFEERASYDLLGHARQAGLVGAPLQHRVTGSATLDVNFNNAPQGTTHRLKADGMFKQIKLSRGRAMPPASQES
jgi:Phage tail lysozyme